MPPVTVKSQLNGDPLRCYINSRRGCALDDIFWDSGEDLVGGQSDRVGHTSAPDPRRSSICSLTAIGFNPEGRLFEIFGHAADRLQSASWPSRPHVGTKS